MSCRRFLSLVCLAASFAAVVPVGSDAQVFRARSSNPQDFVELAGVAVFFAATGEGAASYDLWRTDGTGLGTSRLGVCSGQCLSRQQFVVRTPDGTEAFFFREDVQTRRTDLWRTDGTVAGTVRLTETGSNAGVPPDPSLYAWSEMRQELFFVVASSSGASTLWITDGTRAGTRPVLAFGQRSIEAMAALGDRLLFSVGTSTATSTLGELWVSDGTAPGTQPIAGVGQSAQSFLALDGRVVFLSRPVAPAPCGVNLWSSDGTAAGTRVLESFDTPRCENLEPIDRAGDWGVFVVAPGVIANLWRTDGTEAGTGPISAFPTADAFPPFSGRPLWQPPYLYFVAGQGRPAGVEIWRSQGSPETTELVADLCPGVCTSQPTLLEALGDGRVLFRSGDFLSGYQPWITDGTAAGTRRLAEPGMGAHVLLGDRLVFTGSSPERGLELWTVDLDGGAPAVALTDFEPIVGAVVLDRSGIGRLGDVVLFAGNDTLHGSELWRSDGTADGTFLLANLVPDGAVPEAPPATPQNLAVVPIAEDHLQVSWDPVPGAERYFLSIRGVEGVPPFQEMPVFDTTVFPPVPPGTPITVQVRAENTLGSSPWTAPVSGTALEPGLLPGDCPSSADALCLEEGRFRVRVHWRNQHAPAGASTHGTGRSIAPPGNQTTGYFWFFTEDNVELIVKLLDGTTVNGFQWAFYGALSDVEYWITLVDTLTGASRTYHNPPGQICGRGDTKAFAGSRAAWESQRADGEAAAVGPVTAAAGHRRTAAAAPGPCAAGEDILCLLDGRYEVTVDWRDQHNDQQGFGRAVPFRDLSGFFWFFHPDNVELVVKVLDGRTVNGKVWVFYGALSDVGYTLRVRETATGRVAEYVNPPGNICGRADTGAF